MWRSRKARTLLVASVVTSTVAPLTACGASSGSSAAAATIQREATLYQIDQIERTFHEAGATHNVNLMMTLWAPGATFNIGTNTYTGKAEIRKFFEKNPAFQPENHWVSDTPSYNIKIRQNGDKATLYMECDYIDVKTKRVTAVVGVDHNLQKINGKWLIVSGAGGAPTALSP